MNLLRKWGLALRVAIIVAILLGVKAVIDFFGLDIFEISATITAFVSGVIFTIAVIFTGTLSHYNESEKIPG